MRCLNYFVKNKILSEYSKKLEVSFNFINKNYLFLFTKLCLIFMSLIYNKFCLYSFCNNANANVNYYDII